VHIGMSHIQTAYLIMLLTFWPICVVGSDQSSFIGQSLTDLWLVCGWMHTRLYCYATQEAGSRHCDWLFRLLLS
jgi:hypothetical protein